MTLALQGVSKRFGDVAALAGVDLAIDEGELLVVVGPSGSGKSTLLRCIAGLEQPDGGSVHVGGKDVTHEPPGKRDIAMVFQEYALYPHLDVVDNIGFGLRARGASKEVVARRVRSATDLLDLNHCAERRPAELSGGERQRVALAQAIVREPRVFLMDEPLANLDAELRTHTRAEIRSLQRRLGTTTIYVTHDQTEAFTLGDRIAVLRAGRVVQADSPRALYDAPVDTFVARFVGSPPMNIVPGAILGRREASIGVRPDRARVVTPTEGKFVGTVKAVEALGSHAIVHVDASGHDVLVVAPGWGGVGLGAQVGVTYEDADLHAFDADGRATR